ncbi:MAG: PQQ-dependent dehydrogenase, methanol/ethanol family [Pseudomonadota bacterium]
MMPRAVVSIALCALLIGPVTHAAAVDAERAAAPAPGDWPAHGRSYAEQRHSPLDAVNRDNVERLGLAWAFELPTRRGQEATPIMVDGVLYVTGSWSMVFALDATTGALKWQYDPGVPRRTGSKACCDAVNRGVAVWQGQVFVGTLDGRLVALDAKDGSVNWSQQTVPTDQAYTITGAPRVVKDRVIIGNGGGEYGVRGYVSAYDVATGELDWRFHTVPGNPDNGFESDAMARAANTWSGEWWRLGGGGTVWDSMAYDPELDLLYVGVGNGSPWQREMRSPGGGDNLFLSSIVALRPDTGSYVWHYQTTPADTWDYTATQHMILADLEIEGRMRKVIMQAPKNGFFYVLDRESGAFISAEPFVNVTWASHVDPETGRPVEAEPVYVDGQPVPTAPSPLGAHNWMPMAWNPDAGLVYIPAMDAPFTHANAAAEPDLDDPLWRTGTDFSAAATPLFIAPAVEEALAETLVSAHLLAWDPVAQKAAWRVQHAHPWNGGVLSTAGGLVFQGDATGHFSAYDAKTGRLMWQRPANTGIVAAPMTYAIDGKQYVAVLAGWGGSMALNGGRLNDTVKGGANGRLLVYALDAAGEPPPGAVMAEMPQPPRNTALDDDIRAGFGHYARSCSVCHGMNAAGGGVIPDLRYLSPEKHVIFDRIVYDGVLAEAGMPGFSHRLTREQVEQVRAYVIYEANREWRRRDDAGWWRAVKNTASRASAWALLKLQ